MKYASLSFLRKFYLSSLFIAGRMLLYHPPVSFSSPTNIHLRNSLACLSRKQKPKSSRCKFWFYFPTACTKRSTEIGAVSLRSDPYNVAWCFQDGTLGILPLILVCLTRNLLSSFFFQLDSRNCLRMFFVWELRNVLFNLGESQKLTLKVKLLY